MKPDNAKIMMCSIVICMVLCGCDSFKSVSVYPDEMYSNGITTSADPILVEFFTGAVTLYIPSSIVQQDDCRHECSFLLDKSTACGNRGAKPLNMLIPAISEEGNRIRLSMPISMVKNQIGDPPWLFSLCFIDKYSLSESLYRYISITVTDNKEDSATACGPNKKRNNNNNRGSEGL